MAPPLPEDVYDAADARVVGGMLNSLLNYAGRVRIACLAQLVNVIGPIMIRTGGPAWRQTIFHPFALASRHGRGTGLKALIRSAAYSCAAGSAVPLIEAAVVQTAAGGINLFVFNRDLQTALEIELELRTCTPLTLSGWDLLHHADLTVTNTEQAPERYVQRQGTGATVSDNRLSATLPPASWSIIRLVPAG